MNLVVRGKKKCIKCLGDIRNCPRNQKMKIGGSNPHLSFKCTGNGKETDRYRLKKIIRQQIYLKDSIYYLEQGQLLMLREVTGEIIDRWTGRVPALLIDAFQSFKKRLTSNILRAWFMRRLMREYAHAFAVNVSTPDKAKEAESFALKTDSRRRDTYIKEYHAKHSSEPKS